MYAASGLGRPMHLSQQKKKKKEKIHKLCGKNQCTSDDLPERRLKILQNKSNDDELVDVPHIDSSPEQIPLVPLQVVHTQDV